jgi:hypothetical protein
MESIVERVRQHLSGLLPPPLSAAEIEEAEQRLTFPLPDLLRELYATVADGGFGPSYGFLPLLKPGPDGSPYESAVLLYAFLRRGDRDHPSYPWPERLLPFLDWGCAVLSCVDCSSPSLPVFRDDSSGSLAAEAPSLEGWLNDWLSGRDLWKLQT